jgi:pimeloyl-ACP methyl ester carboxylesterase
VLLEHRLSVRGVVLRVTCEGPEDRRLSGVPAVVALHGGPGVDGDGLRWFLRPLASEIDVIVMDQRGHGLSDLATAATWELDEWADDVAAVIDSLELQHPVVFGISFGGWVALRYASRHPRQAAALVVAAQTARLLCTAHIAERMDWLGGAASKRAWLHAHQSATGPDTDFAEHCLSLMSVRRPPASLVAVRTAQLLTQQVNDHFTPQFDTLDLTGDAAEVGMPFTLVLGERDPFTTAELARQTVAAVLGPRRLVLVPDAAHDLMVDAPDVLLAEIRRSCAQRRRRPPSPRA